MAYLNHISQTFSLPPTGSYTDGSSDQLALRQTERRHIGAKYYVAGQLEQSDIGVVRGLVVGRRQHALDGVGPVGPLVLGHLVV